MLSDGADIVVRVGSLLDDPANATFTQEYLLPFLNQAAEEMDNDLENYDLQYLEGIAIFPVDVGVSDLSGLLQDGQPLASMKFPKSVDWKLPSDADGLYRDSDFVDELDDVDANSYGALEWRNANGAIQITPSSQPIVLRVYYDSLSTDRWDPHAQVIRGTGHVMALRIARDVCAVAGDLKMRYPYFEKRSNAAWNTFIGVLVQAKQSQQNIIPSIHNRQRTRIATAGGQGILL